MKKRIEPKYRKLRLNQLSQSLAAFEAASAKLRPRGGWLRAVREALGLSTAQVAQAIPGEAKPHGKAERVREFEKAEADDRITLASLRRIADAMGCKLVYAIIPKTGTIGDLANERARNQASRRVRAIEHSMALEDQAVGKVNETIDEETKRILGDK